MRTTIRDETLAWKEVISRVPQGSVLGPIMFAIYIHDMIEGVDSCMSMLADDAKLLRRVEKEEGCVLLQGDFRQSMAMEKKGKWNLTPISAM